MKRETGCSKLEKVTLTLKLEMTHTAVANTGVVYRSKRRGAPGPIGKPVRQFSTKLYHL